MKGNWSLISVEAIRDGQADQRFSTAIHNVSLKAMKRRAEAFCELQGPILRKKGLDVLTIVLYNVNEWEEPWIQAFLSGLDFTPTVISERNRLS